MMTIVHHGGEWWRGSNAGITHRDVAGEPFTVSDVAASRRRHLKMFIHYYTDKHNVDEDMVTINDYGGNWNTWGISEATGMMCRVMNDTPIDTYDSVASISRHPKIDHLLFGLPRCRRRYDGHLALWWVLVRWKLGGYRASMYGCSSYWFWGSYCF